MKRETTAEALGMISDRYITEAAEYEPRRSRIRVRGAGIAAACLVIAAAGVFAVSYNRIDKTDQSANVSAVQTGIAYTRPYNRSFYQSLSGRATVNETAVIWPWEYKTVYEKYPEAEFGGKEYSLFSTEALEDASLVGEAAGSCTLKGYDLYTEQWYTKEAPAFTVKGADSCVIAVKIEEGYVLYRTDIDENVRKPLDELLQAYGLTGTMSFSRYSQYKGHEMTGGEYRLASGGRLVQMLAHAEYKEVYVGEKYPAGLDERTQGISLAVSCPGTTIDNRVLTIDRSGTIMTNIFDVRYTCTVDKETADKLIDFAEGNQDFYYEEPESAYERMIGGKVTEIGEGYIKIDDSVICEEASQGVIFTVPTEDIRIRRCIEFSPKPAVGDIVAVYFSGSLEADGTVNGAYGLVKANLSQEGGLYTEE